MKSVIEKLYTGQFHRGSGREVILAIFGVGRERLKSAKSMYNKVSNSGGKPLRRGQKENLVPWQSKKFCVGVFFMS